MDDYNDIISELDNNATIKELFGAHTYGGCNNCRKAPSSDEAHGICKESRPCYGKYHEPIEE